METTTPAKWILQRLTIVPTILTLVMIFTSGVLAANASPLNSGNPPLRELASKYSGTLTVQNSQNANRPKGTTDAITISVSEGIGVGGGPNNFNGTFTDSTHSQFNGPIHNGNLQTNGNISFTVHPNSGGTFLQFPGKDLSSGVGSISGSYNTVDNSESGSFNLAPTRITASTNKNFRQFAPEYEGTLPITQSKNTNIPTGTDQIIFNLVQGSGVGGGNNNFVGIFTDDTHSQLSGRIHNGNLQTNGSFTFTVHPNSGGTFLEFGGKLHPRVSEGITGSFFTNDNSISGTFKATTSGK